MVKKKNAPLLLLAMCSFYNMVWETRNDFFFFQKDNLYLQLYQKTLHKENFIKKKTEKSKIKKEYWVLLI